MLNGQEFQSLFLVFELSQPIWDCYIYSVFLIIILDIYTTVSAFS